MELSVVVPTLDGREQLAGTLDSVAANAPEVEVIVVNGPSTDGTTGMVRDRTDVDVLVEIADRSINAARNAGIEHASGDAVALVNQGLSLTAEWIDALRAGFREAPVVTGPTHRPVRAGKTTEPVERGTIAGRTVTYVNPGNLGVTRKVIDDLDGFDEYLDIGGARDFSHRVAGIERSVSWQPEMAVERVVGADGGSTERDWGWKYRSLAYRLAKNYGLRPAVIGRVYRNAVSDGTDALGEVFNGERQASVWLDTGRQVIGGVVRGLKDGLTARARDRSQRRNPRGRSSRRDRAVSVFEN
ncbi:glycosyltransferase family 2 protein [Halorhabdus amylolytica]|uniref:glycosyltransferase family 2 protein n=1 Tax=Halorhabdus amylolytica TaxID=2559573 RepID=UPI0010AB27C9|nr:glycosyltransferase family A protein [Halorhabdus amylolytica]